MPILNLHSEESEARLRNALKIFWRPIAFFGIFSIAILAIDNFITHSERETLKRYASEDLAVVARLNSEEISRWVEDRLGDAQMLVSQMTESQEIDKWIADGAPQDERSDEFFDYLTTMNAYRKYSRISLVDTAGRTLLSTDGSTPGADPLLVQIEREALRTRAPQISSIRLSAERPDVAEMIICAPVLSPGERGRVAALLLLVINPQRDLFPQISRWPGRSATAETNILMRVGDSVRFLTVPRLGTGAWSREQAKPLELPITSDTAAAAAARGYRGTMEGTDYRGAAVLAAITDVPNTPWQLVTKADVAEFYEPFERLRMIGFGGAVLLILIAGVTLLAILRREQSNLIVRQLKAELREREISQRLAYLSKNTDEIILLVDEAGRIAEANERALAAYGYSPEELIGRAMRDLHPVGVNADYIQQSHTGSATKTAAAFQSVQARKDSSLFPVEISARWIKREGTPWLQLVIRDTTERGERIAALTQLAAIVDSAGGAIIGEDLNGNVRTWNPAAEKLFGYTSEEMIGNSANILLPADRLDEIERLIERIRAGESVSGSESVRRRKDGSLVDVSLIYSPVYNSEGTLVGISAIIIDISERVRAVRRAEYVSRALRTLSRANETLIRATSEQELFERMCKVITDSGGYRMAWIGLRQNDPEKSVRAVTSSGVDEGYVKAVRVSWADTERGRGPTGTAIRTGIPQINQNFASNPNLAPWREAALQRGYGSSIALPLNLSDGTIYGALTIYAPEPDAFGADEVELLEELGDDIAFGVETIKNRLAREELAANMAEAMESTIAAVANTVEMRDLYTAGHQRRVTEIAEAIARKLGLSDDKIRGLRLAGIVHDLGKINVPSDILNKPAKLSAVEYELIKTHPQTGYDILKHVKFPWPIAEIILQHHERMDGSGYPNGLKGDQILLEARIIAVADVIDSMMSHRPYRPALGIEAALAEIRQGSGKIYDPAVVEACVQVMKTEAARFAAPLDASR